MRYRPNFGSLSLALCVCLFAAVILLAAWLGTYLSMLAVQG